MILLLGCAPVEYDVADLQLELEGSIPVGAERMRVCVEAQLVHEEGAGNGRIAVTGLWTDRPALLRVEVEDADGVELAQAGPVELDLDQPWRSTPQLDPDGEACSTEEDPLPAGTDSWLLAVRFTEEALRW